MALRVLVVMAVRVGAMAELVEISNKEPRLDVAGNIMDCHDGNILHIGGAYWNFCMEYGSCPGRPLIYQLAGGSQRSVNGPPWCMCISVHSVPRIVSADVAAFICKSII